jgi:hypothetical protein
VSADNGLVVPIPTLLPDCVMTEFPIALDPVKTGMVPVAPLPAICAEPNAVINKQNPTTEAKLDRPLLTNMPRSLGSEILVVR